MPSQSPVGPPKALFRGWIHLIACLASIPMGLRLVQDAPLGDVRNACILYAISQTVLFFSSALYHVPTWNPTQRLFFRKIDHAAIYMLIAGTYTPFCVLASEDLPHARLVLVGMWLGATAGVANCIWTTGGFKSKILSSILYIGLGWCGTPALASNIFDSAVLNHLIRGGVLYSLGGIMYALKFPQIVPRIFSYHEVFHIFVVLANLQMYHAIRIAM